MKSDKKILNYIDNFWADAVTPAHKSKWGSARNSFMHVGRIKLPNRVISPNYEYFAGTQFYWDTYFTVIGLLEADKTELARGMVDNLLFLYRKFGFIPASNTLRSIGRSQPPFLTRMAFEVYAKTKDDGWLDEVMKIAQEEYLHCWNNDRRFDRQIGLSRYAPWKLKKFLTTYESGWDVSSRFADGKSEVIPIDLNCLLYRYEKDIEAWCQLRKRTKEALTWKRRAAQRLGNVNEFCWNDKVGFFFDYNAETKQMDTLFTLAGFFPLWAGLATKKQASKCVANLSRFQQSYGVSTTEEIAWQGRQWDHPNSWPPLQLLLIEGLRKYDYMKLADKETKKWLQLVQRVFTKTGQIWEKYNIVDGEVGVSARYPTQPGFAWTIAVYLRLVRYSNRDSKK